MKHSKIMERKYLKDVTNLFKSIDIDSLVQVILTDEDVQFWWALVCTKLENDLADVLLENVVRQWVTLRRFIKLGGVINR